MTPQQIENINSFLNGDMDLLEGYDEIPKELQEKVDFALANGHVQDEDWKGVSPKECHADLSYPYTT